MSVAYDDSLTSPEGCESLWQQVLLQAVEDAVHGVKTQDGDIGARVLLTQRARTYITIPNKGFNEVCYLAGMDPQAVRDRVAPMIAAAPSPEEIAGTDAPPLLSRLRAFPRKPAPNSRMITFNGRTMNITAWAREIGVSCAVLRNRLGKGWPIERALTEPLVPPNQRRQYRKPVQFTEQP